MTRTARVMMAVAGGIAVCAMLPACGGVVCDGAACDGAPCGGILGTTCAADEFCKRPNGSCDGTDVAGACTVVADVCTEIFQPVCGCDGETYGNACEADAASVSISVPGECP